MILPLTGQPNRAGSGGHSAAKELDSLSNMALLRGDDWDPNKTEGYRRNTIVRDGRWQMVSDVDNNVERPAPQPQGDPYLVREVPGTPPAWATNTLTETAIYIVQRFTFPEMAFLLETPFYISGANLGNRAEVWIVPNPLVAPNPQVIVPTFEIGSDRVDQWISLAAGFTAIAENRTFDLVQVLRSTTGQSQWSGEWDAKRTNGAPSEGEANHQSGNVRVRIHHTDKNDGDRTAELQALNAGDQFMVSGATYDITATAHNANDVELTYEPANRPQENLYTYTFITYGELPLEYVYVPGWYSAMPGVQGAVAGEYVPDQITMTDDLFGLDLRIQDMQQPQNWSIFDYAT